MIFKIPLGSRLIYKTLDGGRNGSPATFVYSSRIDFPQVESEINAVKKVLTQEDIRTQIDSDTNWKTVVFSVDGICALITVFGKAFSVNKET